MKAKYETENKVAFIMSICKHFDALYIGKTGINCKSRVNESFRSQQNKN